jgi:hypothetical protein
MRAHVMDANRSQYGLLVSVLGALLLVVAVFLPWYGLSFTANGIATVQQTSHAFVNQYGNPALQGQLSGFYHADLGALAGRQITAVSAHQTLKDLGVVLLLAAGAAVLLALIPLVRPQTSADDGAGLALVGVLAAICVIYRMMQPPTPPGGLLSLSLREGSWLALLGSLAIMAGGLWPRRMVSLGKPRTVWADLSGWTPES